MASSQLDNVIRMAKERRDEAAQRLADGQAGVRSAQQQVEQLVQYQQMYLEQNRAESMQGMSVHSLAQARQFIGELSHLIDAQQNLVVSKEREAEALAEAWREASQYQQAVEKLAQIRKTEAAVAREKREQQQLDDLFSQQLGYLHHH